MTRKSSDLVQSGSGTQRNAAGTQLRLTLKTIVRGTVSSRSAYYYYLKAAPLPPTPLWFQAVRRLICSPAPRQAHFWSSWRVLGLIFGAAGAPGGSFGRSWRRFGLRLGDPGGSWGSKRPQESPKRGQKRARRAPTGARSAPRGPQGPPKGPPKSPPKRSKIAAPKSIVKYGVSSWKIAFLFGLAAFFE